jgi:cell division control protein 45
VILQSSNQEVGHIRTENELKLMLLRHWTLFDSIENSNYMVSKMAMWQEPGKKELRRFLAKLSIPIDQAK